MSSIWAAVRSAEAPYAALCAVAVVHLSLKVSLSSWAFTAVGPWRSSQWYITAARANGINNWAVDTPCMSHVSIEYSAEVPRNAMLEMTSVLTRAMNGGSISPKPRPRVEGEEARGLVTHFLGSLVFVFLRYDYLDTPLSTATSV